MSSLLCIVQKHVHAHLSIRTIYCLDVFVIHELEVGSTGNILSRPVKVVLLA